MTATKSIRSLPSRMLTIVLIAIHLSSCYGQANENAGKEEKHPHDNPTPVLRQKTLFPQIHTNLNGMVREFVRAMYQDTNGNYWFGTNGDGIIRYNGDTLEKILLPESNKHMAVRKIVEDKAGHVWFGTSDGLIKYAAGKFSMYTESDGLLDNEIWDIAIDKNGLVWIGTVEGVCQFDGKIFTPFILPDTKVENPEYMLSDKLAKGFVEDADGNRWINTDGNGIFKYKNAQFTHLTKANGLTDNNTGGLLIDKHGHVWIGTFYGGLSKFDGRTYTNFTQDGMIEGIEIGSLYEDSQGNIWFSAENVGVYKYDGITFTLYTTQDGLATNTIQSIFEDNKGQLWFGTWQGISLYDGDKFMNASDKEPWVK